MSATTVLAALSLAPQAKNNPPCPGCGWATNANGNCFNNSCWNANSKRHR